MQPGKAFDLIVVGGGMGGMATAGLAQRFGLRTALLEAHTKLGGCAGYFTRGTFTFDAGATALMGLGRDEPIGALLQCLGVEFESVKTPEYRVHLPDRNIVIVPDSTRFEAEMCMSFPGKGHARRFFWRLQEAVGKTLLEVAGRLPRLPLQSLGDLVYDLQALGLRGVLAASLGVLTVRDVMRLLGLDNDTPFRSLVAILLQDTAQAGPESVPFANAAACLQAYRLGMSRPSGGMRALAEGIGQRFAQMGGELRTATKVDRIEADGAEGFIVVTRRGDRLKTHQVALNLPLDLAADLLGTSLEGRLARSERGARAAWSAFTGYIAINRAAIPDDSPLFHQVLQDYDKPIHDGNNVLVSLSPLEDEGYGPAGVRLATMSTHTRPGAWANLANEAYAVKKADYASRMLAALQVALPETQSGLIHAEFASPRSFARYTRRTLGAVGGPPVSRRNSNLLSVGSDIFGPGLWVVGDSVFPGQGTMATVLSAIRVVERISGKSWPEMSREGSRKAQDVMTCPN